MNCYFGPYQPDIKRILYEARLELHFVRNDSNGGKNRKPYKTHVSLRYITFFKKHFWSEIYIEIKRKIICLK